jgi:hypothetical protein
MPQPLRLSIRPLRLCVLVLQKNLRHLRRFCFCERVVQEFSVFVNFVPLVAYSKRFSASLRLCAIYQPRQSGDGGPGTGIPLCPAHCQVVRSREVSLSDTRGGMARRWHGRPARDLPTFSSAGPEISGSLLRSLFMGETPMPPPCGFPVGVRVRISGNVGSTMRSSWVPGVTIPPFQTGSSTGLWFSNSTAEVQNTGFRVAGRASFVFDWRLDLWAAGRGA